MLRVRKKELVSQVSDILKNNNSFIFFSYNKFTVSCMTHFKLKLKQGGANLKIVKNRLAKVAVTGVFHDKATKVHDFFKGNSMGIIYGDIGFCSKEFKSFTKDNANILSVVGGIVEGEVFNSNGFEYFTNLPSKDELVKKLRILIASPVLALQKIIALPAIALKKIGSAASSL